MEKPPKSTTPRRGRPVQETHKQAITLRLDPQVLATWRASGKGWQTRAAQVLAVWINNPTPTAQAPYTGHCDNAPSVTSNSMRRLHT